MAPIPGAFSQCFADAERFRAAPLVRFASHAPIRWSMFRPKSPNRLNGARAFPTLAIHAFTCVARSRGAFLLPLEHLRKTTIEPRRGPPNTIARPALKHGKPPAPNARKVGPRAQMLARLALIREHRPRPIHAPRPIATGSGKRSIRGPHRCQNADYADQNAGNSMKAVTLEQAVAVVESGQRIFVHEAAMVPEELLQGLAARASTLRNVEVVHLHICGKAPHLDPAVAPYLRHNALFVGENARAAVGEGRADFTPIFLSDVPPLFRSRGSMPIDVAFLHVSPPDRHGFCRLGVSVSAARSAADNAKTLVALVNPRVPITSGNTSIHIDRIDYAVQIDRPLFDASAAPIDDVARRIGERVALEVADGATLQMGIGAIPDAVLTFLDSKNDLGVHTEMFSDGLVRLAKQGVITGRSKTRFQGRIVSSFAIGSQGLYDYCDQNPSVEFHPSDIVNDPHEIRKQFRMTAINSAIEVDLTGQVCADSIGDRIVSGIGGQVDFMRGAACAAEGKAILALPSTARGGTISRITPTLAEGAGVVTSRGHVHWVVTEYGAVNLHGRSLRERAEMLIEIAHPDFRTDLRNAAVKRRVLPVP